MAVSRDNTAPMACSDTICVGMHLADDEGVQVLCLSAPLLLLQELAAVDDEGVQVLCLSFALLLQEVAACRHSMRLGLMGLV